MKNKTTITLKMMNGKTIEIKNGAEWYRTFNPDPEKLFFKTIKYFREKTGREPINSAISQAYKDSYEAIRILPSLSLDHFINSEQFERLTKLARGNDVYGSS